jgi:transcriptional regulator with XRE-family HTH domain
MLQKTRIMQKRTLGDILREARLAKKLGLRELAREMGITPSYVSDIENDRRIPSEEVFRKLSTRLDLNADELLALAGRFSEEAERYMKRNPSVGMLFRRITENKLKEDEIQKLADQADEFGKDRRKDKDK